MHCRLMTRFARAEPPSSSTCLLRQTAHTFAKIHSYPGTTLREVSINRHLSNMPLPPTATEANRRAAERQNDVASSEDPMEEAPNQVLTLQPGRATFVWT